MNLHAALQETFRTVEDMTFFVSPPNLHAGQFPCHGRGVDLPATQRVLRLRECYSSPRNVSPSRRSVLRFLDMVTYLVRETQHFHRGSAPMAISEIGQGDVARLTLGVKPHPSRCARRHPPSLQPEANGTWSLPQSDTPGGASRRPPNPPGRRPGQEEIRHRN